MSFRVERTEYDPQDGFLYYVVFKPALELDKEEIQARIPVQAAVSLTETGDLADLTFELPKTCRTGQALTFMKQPDASYVEPRVFIALPGQSGDAVINAPAKLDLDLAGRIIGMEIQWAPSERAAGELPGMLETPTRGTEKMEREDKPEAPIARVPGRES